MPGGTRYHQSPELTDPASRASCSSPPQDTTAGSPSPRKARVASARIAEEMISVVCARMSGITLGSTCRDMMCQCPPPSALARSMYGRDSTASVCARTRRAVVGQVVTPIASTIVPSDRDSTVASTIASTSVGITRNQSVIRIITVAYQPRKWPAVIPMSAPISTESTAASSPTRSDTREPQISRPSRLRPNWSVPSGNRPLGLSSGCPGASVTLSTSDPTVSGAVSATSTNSTSVASPNTPARCLRYSFQKRATEARRRRRASARGPGAPDFAGGPDVDSVVSVVSALIGPPSDRASDTAGRPGCSSGSPRRRRRRTGPAPAADRAH